MVRAPMEQIINDILGPLPETLWKNSLFLITKWTESCPKPNQGAATVAEKIVSKLVYLSLWHTL